MNIELVKVRRKKNRLLITEAIELFAFTLLHPRTVEVLDIIVEMKDLGHADGYCGWEDSNINPRSFTIELDKKLAGSELIKTIAHEMVHLKQFAKGELKERFKPTYCHIWHGDIVDRPLPPPSLLRQHNLETSGPAHQSVHRKYTTPFG